VTLLCTGAALWAAGAAASPPRVTEQHAGIAPLIVQEINAFRAKHGLAPVRPTPALRLSALNHTRDQARAGRFGHDSSDGTTFADRVARYYGPHGYKRWSVGENLLYGPVSISPAEALQAWIESPPHRETLLDPQWRDIGIVALVAPHAPGEFGGRDVVVVTTDFGNRVR